MSGPVDDIETRLSEVLRRSCEQFAAARTEPELRAARALVLGK